MYVKNDEKKIIKSFKLINTLKCLLECRNIFFIKI